jgi:tetratricopeptide (TPR) repeat protein
VKRIKLILATLVCLLSLAPHTFAAAKDNWTSVRSRNFYLVGNASEKNIRKVATRLEQFREVLARLLKVKLDSPIPINVVVFKSHDSYKSFGPPGSSGYFQSGSDVNYIALDAELQGENPFDTIFHEYVHFMINNNIENVPIWFNEGLAEFYSTFSVSEGDKKVTIGAPISNHVLYLRQEKLIPLQTLFAVDHQSPLYNESNKRGVFYAESWVLVHYLMHGDEGRHRPQLWQFLDKVIAGTPVEAAFQQAFQTDFKSMEKTLKSYIQRDGYAAQFFEFNEKVESDAQMQSALLSEAEAEFYLGDLMLHSHQLDKAEKHLRQAVALDGNLTSARASLGMLNMYQRRFSEAKQHLQRAVAGDSKNYLAHYYYAYVLSREGMGEGGLVMNYEPEIANLMRSELKKAISLKPEYAESYHLLAFVNLITGEQLNESIELLKRAMSLAPGEQQFGYVLAQIYMRQRDFKTARQILEPIARNNAEQELQAQAQAMLNQLTSLEEQMARFDSGGSSEGGPALGRRDTSSTKRVVAVPGGAGGMQAAIESVLGKTREGEVRVRGLLLNIDCSSKGAFFIVKVADRELKFQAGAGVAFMSFTPDISGGVGCGQRNPPNEVVVTYRTAAEGRAKTDGEVVSVAIVPKDFVLK